MKYFLIFLLILFAPQQIAAQKRTGKERARRDIYGLKDLYFTRIVSNDSVPYQGDTTDIDGTEFITEALETNSDWVRSYFRDEEIDEQFDSNPDIFCIDEEILYTFSLMYKGDRRCGPVLKYPPDSCFQKAIRSSFSPETIRKIKLFMLFPATPQIFTPVFLCKKDGSIRMANFIAHVRFQRLVPPKELARLCIALKSLRFRFKIPDCFEHKPASPHYEVYVGRFLSHFQYFFGADRHVLLTSLF